VKTQAACFSSGEKHVSAIIIGLESPDTSQMIEIARENTGGVFLIR
jgi:hypothetical protein